MKTVLVQALHSVYPPKINQSKASAEKCCNFPNIDKNPSVNGTCILLCDDNFCCIRPSLVYIYFLKSQTVPPFFFSLLDCKLNELVPV